MKNKMFKQGMDIRILGLALILMLAGIVAGCAGSSEKGGVPPDDSILRIGVSTNYPPLIFQQDEDVVGAEADLARELAAYLGKKPVFVDVSWADQIDQLVAGHTDIIMAGMSVTEERLYRINFSKAYFKTGQMVLVANKPVFQHLDNFPALRAQVVSLRVGVVENTTGEVYVMENLNMARKVVRYKSSAAAIEALKGDKIHIFVHDGVRILMLEAANKQYGFKKIPLFLTDEYIAWGVRKNDDALLASANAFLDEIKGNGKLKEILSRWIPNIGDLK
ncbi:MAG: transporter substrate-binding domain-containing protein [Thermodesulfobacteriota bacterium]